MSQVPPKSDSPSGPASGAESSDSLGQGLSPAWLENPPSSDSPNRPGKSNLRALVLAPVLLALLGSTLGFISWIGRVQTPMLFTVMVTEYEQPWIIPVPLGQKDRQILTSGRVFDRVHPVPAASLDRQQILAILTEVEKVGPRENVVVYVSARAIAGPDGKLLLLPSDARVENLRGSPTILNTVALEDLFRSLARCPASRKLLVLDIFNPLISVPQGILQIDLPGACMAELEAFQKDGANPFHVLMTCAPGQRSFATQAIDSSPFCHFLAKAVNGELPAIRGSNLNRYGKVYLSDLQDVLVRHVDRWTSFCNLARQTPLMLGTGPDMLLGLPKIRYVPSQVIASKVSENWTSLKGWIPFMGPRKPADDPEGTAAGAQTDGDSGEVARKTDRSSPAGGGEAAVAAAGKKDTESPAKDDAKKAEAGAKPGAGAGDNTAEAEKKDKKQGKPAADSGVAAAGAGPSEAGDPAKVLQIPPEVEAAWELLDKWTSERVEVDYPRLMNRLADQARQGLLYHLLGVDRKNYVEQLRYETGLIRAELERRKSELPSPGVMPSLGMMMAEGVLAQTPEPMVKSLQKAILSVDPAKISGPDGAAMVQKAAEEWTKANPAAGKADIELACVNAMINLPDTVAANWRAAAEILFKLRGEPRTSEGRLLMRLGGSTTASVAAPDLAQTCLSTSLRCNQAAARWRCYSRIGSIMDSMMENCSDGTWLVEYSPSLHASEASALLSEARRSAIFVEGFEQVYNESRSIIWQAVQDFSAFESFPLGLPAGWDKYADRMEQMIELFEQLESASELPRFEIEKIVSRLRTAAQDLAKSYQEVHVAVQTEGIQEFVRISGSGNVSPAVLPEVESALRLGGQPLKNRLTLITCYLKIQQRVVGKIQAIENQERSDGTPAPARPDYDQTDPSRSEQRSAYNLERVSFITERLRLLGVPEAELAPLRVKGETGPGTLGLREAVDKGGVISRLFLVKVPELIEADRRIAFRANLAYPGWLSNKTLDQPGSNPAGKVIREERENYLFWVVSRLRHQSRMGLDKDFSSEMAGFFGNKFNIQGISDLSIIPAKPVHLRLPGEETTVQVHWTGDLIRYEDVAASVLRGSLGPFSASIRGARPSGAGGTVEVALRRDPSAVVPTRVGYDFVLEFRNGSRRWYGLVAILPDDDGSRPSLVISDPGEDGSVYGDTLPLRGSGSKKAITVRLRQDSGKAENLAITISPSRSAPADMWGPANLALPTGISSNLPFDGFLSGVGQLPAGGNPPEKTQPAVPRRMNAPGELLFEIRDLAKVSDSVVNRSLKVLRVDPGELVEILSASVSPGRGQVTPSSNLRVEVRAKRTPLAGPPCRVELSVEGPASVQGIRGNLRGTVPANGDTLVLEAQGIPAVGEGTGVFTLSVDGVPLTYRFSADFAVFDRVEGAELERVPFLGLKASMALPARNAQGSMASTSDTPKIRVEAWASQSPAGSTLRLQLLGGDQFKIAEKVEILPGPIESVVTVEPGDKGAWLFSLKEGRWNREWDSEGIAGRKMVRLELLGPDGGILATRETTLIVDTTPPRFGQFFGFPEKLAPGTTSRFSFMVSDEESGISSVQAYLGPPKPLAPPAGSPPAAPVVPPPVVEVIPSGNAREVRLDVPVDAKGSVTLTIQALNGSGLETIWSQAIAVADVPPPTVGGLRGGVTEAGRAQGGLPVVLKDDKGKEAQKTVTDQSGAYLFEGLKPGKYTVEVKKSSSRRSASAKVEIKAGPPAVANLNLLE